MKLIIIQPMRGLTAEEILNKRCKAAEKLGAQHTILNTYFNNGENNPIYWLGKSIQAMSQCDGIYCLKGWENGRGCKIEHEVAKKYGLKILYEE